MRSTAPAMRGRALPGPVNYAQIPELAERGFARLSDFLNWLDAHQADCDYLARSGYFFKLGRAELSPFGRRFVKVSRQCGKCELRLAV